jgi:hypothetical protein
VGRFGTALGRDNTEKAAEAIGELSARLAVMQKVWKTWTAALIFRYESEVKPWSGGSLRSPLSGVGEPPPAARGHFPSKY